MGERGAQKRIHQLSATIAVLRAEWAEYVKVADEQGARIVALEAEVGRLNALLDEAYGEGEDAWYSMGRKHAPSPEHPIGQPD